MIDDEEKTMFDRNYLSQAPNEILNIPMSPGKKSVRHGSFTITTAELPYLEAPGRSAVVDELPYTGYDHRLFKYFLDLVRTRGPARVFRLPKSGLPPELTTEIISDTNQPFEIFRYALLKWYAVTLSITDYMQFDNDSGDFKKIPQKIMRIIAAVEESKHGIRFEISKAFCNYVKEQDQLKKIAVPAAPTPIATEKHRHPDPGEITADHGPAKKTKEKSPSLAAPLFMLLFKWTNQEKIKVAVAKLITRLEVDERYAQNHDAFFRQLTKDCLEISQKSCINVLLQGESRPNQNGVDVLTYLRFEISLQENNIAEFKQILHRNLGRDVYKYYAPSVDLLVSQARLLDVDADSLFNLMEYAYFNMANFAKNAGEDLTGPGSIREPFDYILNELNKSALSSPG